MKRLSFIIRFLAFYVWEVILSNLRVAWDVITPRHRMSPGIIALPLEPGLSEAQVASLANLITMTPGTLSLDVTPDRRTLFIHAMYLGPDPAALKRELKSEFERRVRDVV